MANARRKVELAELANKPIVTIEEATALGYGAGSTLYKYLGDHIHHGKVEQEVLKQAFREGKLGTKRAPKEAA